MKIEYNDHEFEVQRLGRESARVTHLSTRRTQDFKWNGQAWEIVDTDFAGLDVSEALNLSMIELLKYRPAEAELDDFFRTEETDSERKS